jgi:hypothetical protein
MRTATPPLLACVTSAFWMAWHCADHPVQAAICKAFKRLTWCSGMPAANKAVRGLAKLQRSHTACLVTCAQMQAAQGRLAYMLHAKTTAWIGMVEPAAVRVEAGFDCSPHLCRGSSNRTADAPGAATYAFLRPLFAAVGECRAQTGRHFCNST